MEPNPALAKSATPVPRKPAASKATTSKEPQARKRHFRLPRFSLQSLLFLVLVTGCAISLWWRWEPWVIRAVLRSDTSGLTEFQISSTGERIYTLTQIDETTGMPSPKLGWIYGQKFTLQAYDTATGRSLWDIKQLDLFGNRERVVASADGRWLGLLADSPYGSTPPSRPRPSLHYIIDAESGAEICPGNYIDEPMQLWALADHGGWIAESNFDWGSRVRVRNAADPKQVAFELPKQSYSVIEFSPDGTKLLTIYRLSSAEQSYEICVWDVIEKSPLFKVPAPKSYYDIDDPVFSPVGNLVALEAYNDTLGRDSHLYDLQTGAFLFKVEGSPRAFDATGTHLETFAWSGMVFENNVMASNNVRNLIWDLGANPPKSTPALEPPDVSWIIKRSEKLQIRSNLVEVTIFEAQSEELLFRGPGRIWGKVSSTRDENRILIEGKNHPYLVDLDARKQVYEFPSSEALISPDGSHVVTKDDSALTLWENRRPEYAWGVLVLPELWLGIVFVLLLLWSLYRDFRGLRKAMASPDAPPAKTGK